MALEFIDSNVLVYAFADNPRAEMAAKILARRCDAGVQVLNEFTNVARRKMAMSWQEIGDALTAIRTLCGTIHPMDIGIHEQALALAERYQFPMFDALVVATALRSQGAVLWSEDMQHGMLVEGRLTIRNPFLDPEERNQPR